MTVRLLAYLNRRYTIRRQFYALLLPGVVVAVGAQTAALAVGVLQPFAALGSFGLAIGTLFVGAALIDRRTSAWPERNDLP